MPQNTIDPVVLAAMIVIRLQTVVSREIAPSQTAVLTVGSSQAGTTSNVIPDHAVLQLNIRSYSRQTRQHMLAAIQRIVRGRVRGRRLARRILTSRPSTATRSPTTMPTQPSRVAAAFSAHFGDRALQWDQQTASEDFSNIPRAAGIPYTYWAIGGTDPQTYRTAEKNGHLDDLPANHSPKFLPVLQPTLRTGTEALTAAALAWLSTESGT